MPATYPSRPSPPSPAKPRPKLTVPLALLRPGAEPGALARAFRAYTRSTGYFLACARKGAMRHDLDGRAVEPVSKEHRTGALKAVQGRRRRPAAQQDASDAGAQVASSE